MTDEARTTNRLLDEIKSLRQHLERIHQRLARLEAREADFQSVEALCPLALRKIGDNSNDNVLSLSRPYSASDRFQFPEHPQLTEIFTFIEKNYHQSISLNEVAREFGYSASYLTSLVRRLTGQTLYQWIVQRRMFQARRLLLTTDSSVCQIAKAVGYLDTGHFVKHFRRLHKKPPKSWREEQYLQEK